MVVQGQKGSSVSSKCRKEFQCWHQDFSSQVSSVLQLPHRVLTVAVEDGFMGWVTQQHQLPRIQRQSWALLVVHTHSPGDYKLIGVLLEAFSLAHLGRHQHSLSHDHSRRESKTPGETIKMG